MLARIMHYCGTVWIMLGLVAVGVTYLLVFDEYGFAGLLAVTGPRNPAHWLVLAGALVPGMCLWWCAARLERRGGGQAKLPYRGD